MRRCVCTHPRPDCRANGYRYRSLAATRTSTSACARLVGMDTSGGPAHDPGPRRWPRRAVHRNAVAPLRDLRIRRPAGRGGSTPSQCATRWCAIAGPTGMRTRKGARTGIGVGCDCEIAGHAGSVPGDHEAVRFGERRRVPTSQRPAFVTQPTTARPPLEGGAVVELHTGPVVEPGSDTLGLLVVVPLVAVLLEQRRSAPRTWDRRTTRSLRGTRTFDRRRDLDQRVSGVLRLRMRPR